MTAYAAGAAIGPPQVLDRALANDGTGMIRHVTVTEKGSSKLAFTIVILSVNPGNIADNSTPDLSPFQQNVVARVAVASSDYLTVGNLSIADIEVSRLVQGPPGPLWAVVVSTGNTSAPSGVNVLTFGYGMIRGG